MVDTNNTWNITSGMDVVGVDEEKIGEVAEAQGDYIVVAKGFFFPTDYYVPASAITSVSDKVYLNVTKDEALTQGWDVVPQDSTTTEVYDDRPITDAGLHIDNPVDAGQVGLSAATHDAEPFDHVASTEHRDTDGRINVALSDEELSAHKQVVDRGQAQVEKVVTEEQQSIDVPVTEERLTIRRREAGADEVVDNAATFEDGTITVPLQGEEVVVDKQAKVREVLEIGKEQVTDTRRVTDTVRREEAHIRDDAGNVIEDVDTRRRR